MYFGNKLSYTYPVYVIGKENSEFFHAQLTCMRHHISATMSGTTRTERWLGDVSAGVNQSLGLLGRQI
jgi:hypothetical protein